MSDSLDSALANATPTPPAPSTLGKRLRKASPYILFLALGVLALFGPLVFPRLVSALYHANAPTIEDVAPATRALATLGDAHAAAVLAAVQQNATGTEIAAGQQGGGWVPSGTVASKFITAAGALILMVVLIWRLQNLTHPGPTQWAKDDYTADFKLLTPVEKFEAYGRMRLQYVLLAAAALVFAALVV